MADGSKIEWLARPGTKPASWNPIRGTKGKWHCVKISPGCKNCYAERINKRFSGGLGYTNGADTVRLDLDVLKRPLHWEQPRTVFVCSMTDIFLDEVEPLDIANVWKAMRLAKKHTFLVLTKRSERMRQWLREWVKQGGEVLPNVWLGVSVENQQYIDERVPHLVETPASIRFVSYEPALGPADFRTYFRPYKQWPEPKLDWIIVGGESGPESRHLDVAWARSTVEQCRAAGVPVFVKQLGANVADRNDVGFDADMEHYVDTGRPTNEQGWPSTVELVDGPDQYQGAPVRVLLADRKGGDPSEWPFDLRLREWPR